MYVFKQTRFKVFILFILLVKTSLFAIVNVETGTFTYKGQTVTGRASSALPGSRGFGFAELFDNDSTTAWFEGRAFDRAGRWIDFRFPQKQRMRGMVLGLGCRKDSYSLTDFTVPAKIAVKLDEKPPLEYTVDWDIKEGVVSPEAVNERKAVIWFESDTAYTSAYIQLKFMEVVNGLRYSNLVMSDMELVDAYDKRFGLLAILSSQSFNPNDLGVVNSPVLFVGDDEPRFITHVLDSLHRAGSALGDVAQIENALNSSADTITNSDELARLAGVLKSQLLTNRKMPRILEDGLATTYMQLVGSISLGKRYWNIWRNVTTKTTARGLEITVRYVPIVN